MTAAAPLRPAAIFTTVAALGIALAALLGRGPGGPGGPRPELPVVSVPPGTDIRGTAGIPGVSLVDAKGVVASEVKTIVLADGARVPFRPVLLRAAAERPLPPPAPGIRRVALEEPELLLLPVPRTREEYEASATAHPTRLTAPSGVLDQGPGEASTIRLRGGARMDTERRGTPWSFRGEEAEVRLPSRDIRAPGPVSIESAALRAKGRTLEASESDGTIRIVEGAAGSVTRSGGADLGGGGDASEIRFSCAGPCTVVQLPAASRGDGLERFRITLERDAVLEQGDGRLAAPRIEVDLSRPPGGGEEARPEEIRAAGGALLTGGREGRDFASRADRLRARPRPDGSTEIRLEGEPSLDLRESAGGEERRTLRVEGRGPADLLLPREGGEVRASFRGGASATLREPATEPGAPPVLRTLRARDLHLLGDRAGASAPTVVREVRAEGDAESAEGASRARAGTIVWTPVEGGGSRTRLLGAVTAAVPAAGALDPVAAAAPGKPRPAGGEGTLLLSAPHEATIDAPPEGDASRGAAMTVTGGAVLRRVLGEQEIYRLTCADLSAALHPGNRAIDRLVASGDARLEGREEGPGGRRYDFRGDRLTVTGDAGTGEARTAEILGTPGGNRAVASFPGEDGGPLSVAADVLRLDRSTGALRAEGAVRGTGVLPESRGPGPAPAARGPAEIACRTLDGVLEAGEKPGTTRARSLEARDEVWLKTETEYASGDRLRWDRDPGEAVLTGDPARVTSRPSAPVKGLEDLCEAPRLRILVRGGRLEAARAEGGGRFVRHRFPPAAPGAKEAPPAERVEARCRGPLAYAPAGTSLAEGVTLVRCVLQDGAWVEKDRMEGADRARLSHPQDADGSAGRLAAAEAESDGAGLSVASSAGWRATGVSRASMAGATIVLESSARHPRFRIEGGGTTQAYRRVVYDYDKAIFTEQVGATVEGGR